jgi:hypothetical protein
MIWFYAKFIGSFIIFKCQLINNNLIYVISYAQQTIKENSNIIVQN